MNAPVLPPPVVYDYPPDPPTRKSRWGQVLRTGAVVAASVTISVAAAYWVLPREAHHSALPGKDSEDSEHADHKVAPIFGTGEIAEAKTEACSAWGNAARTITEMRKPFIDSGGDITLFNQAQIGVWAQLETIKNHMPPALPTDLYDAITDYSNAYAEVFASYERAIASNSKQALDETHAAEKRVNADKDKIVALCKQ